MKTSGRLEHGGRRAWEVDAAMVVFAVCAQTVHIADRGPRVARSGLAASARSRAAPPLRTS